MTTEMQIEQLSNRAPLAPRSSHHRRTGRDCSRNRCACSRFGRRVRASIESVLARLGPAEELAAQYRDGLLIRRASRSISPVLLLRASVRLATKGVFGVLVFLLGLFGYVIGANLVLTALVKPFLPEHTGLWLDGNGNFMSAGLQVPVPDRPRTRFLAFGTSRSRWPPGASLYWPLHGRSAPHCAHRNIGRREFSAPIGSAGPLSYVC